MNRKHEKTLAAIFVEPVLANVAWDDVVSLLGALGAAVAPAGGSMFTVVLNGVRAVIHRPHPGRELQKPLVRRVRRFLDEAGVGP
jgi:hypothetical protein